MRRYAYIILTMGFMLVTFTPAFVFAYLKYYGLEDYEPSEGVEESEETSSCKVLFKLQNFDKLFPSQQGLCAAFICTADGCGVKSVNAGEETFYVQNEAVRTVLDSEFERVSAAEPEASESDGEEVDAVEVFESNYEYALWQWLSIFSFAIAFSLLGITTSVISRRGVSSGGDLSRNASGFVVVYFMACASGLVMVALFAGGFLQGNLFPDFSGDVLDFGFNSWVALSFRGDDWFKLAIWCYIAGFYERFVPQILDQVMRRAEGDKGDEKAQGGEAKNRETKA